MGKTFKHAPLKEAVFEIRFPPDLYAETKRADFYNLIKKDFPQIFVPIAGPAESFALKPYDFKNNDGTKLIKYSINRFSFHTQEYSKGFEAFEEECLKYTNLLIDFLKIQTLDRIGLRYINEIPVIRRDGIIKLSDYLKISFDAPDFLTTDPELFHYAVLAKVDDGKLRLLTQCQILPLGGEVIVLDFDYFFENKIKAKDFNVFLSKAHDNIKNKIFLKLISDKYRTMLEKSE